MARPIAQIKQLAGVLNTDDNNEVMPPFHHKMAKNVVFRGNGDNLRVENRKGNVIIPNTYLPNTGVNECTGSFVDTVKGRIIWFNYNSGGKNGIYQYKFSTGLVSPLLISLTNSATDILEFDLNYPIASVNIIYASDDIGDTLIWLGRNKRPMKLNIKDAEANLYGSTWLQDYLTVARQMPLIAPPCAYADDSTVDINNLRKKLYEFRYRWVYKDFTTSTWSPYSKLFSPINPDDVANNIDEHKDNRIDVTINTGNADVVKIEIAARQTEATTFSDCFLVVTLNKASLGLVDNSLYTYGFYNDGSYPALDVQETDLLFDYVPKLANAQELLNGNTIIYGGITEGYNFDETLDIDISISLIEFQQTTPISSGSTLGTTDFTTWLWGLPEVGDVVTIHVKAINPISFVEYEETFIYNVTIIGDTISNIITDLISDINGTPHWSATSTTVGGNLGLIITPDAGWEFSEATTTITLGGGGSIAIDGVSNSIYKHKSRQGFGLVYFDEFGVTNGVVTEAAMLVEWPELTTTGDTVTQIPKIHIEISSQPPIWAKFFSFVRTSNLSVEFLFPTVTCSTKKDSDYGYLEITNQQANQTNLPAYSFSEGDRVRIIGVNGSAIGTVYDFPIQSYKTDPTISGSVVTGDFIVVPYDAVLSNFDTPGYSRYDIEIYTPAKNTSATQQVYYEFGETYQVLTPGTNTRAHQGQSQDQIFGTQPSVYDFIRGDFYLRQRKIPNNADQTGGSTAVWIVDQSVSDLFPSKVVGNGRAFVVDEYARENYFPTMSRWSLAYQQDTSINQTNRFYPLNFDEIDRAKGDIQRFKTRDRILRVFQNRACGQYGVYARFIQNNAGESTLVTTNDIITTNNINYYDGEYGMGDQYTSLISGKNQDYFVDPIRGYHMRLSNDGLTPLNEIYKGQFYIRDLLVPYSQDISGVDGARARILGCYDYFEEECMIVLKGYNTLNIVTDANLPSDVLVTYLPMIFSGTPIANFKIHISITSGITTETFDYTIQSGDTIEDIVDAIVALVNGTSVVFVATKESSSYLIIEKILLGGLVSGSATMTWMGSNGSALPSSNTLTFNEKRNAYSALQDIYPEWIVCANDILYAWHNGDFYVHNSDTYCNFFGVQYYPSIKLVFNDKVAIKKVFDAIAYQGNQIWVSDTNGDINTSMVNPQTGLQQISQIKSVDYEIQENIRYAALLRDANSGSNAAVALLEGDYLVGVHIECNFIYKGSQYAWLYLPYVNYQVSNRNL